MLNINSCVQKRSAGGKQGSLVKKLKKDKATGATGKATRPEPNIVTMAPRVKPELPLPTMYSLAFSYVIYTSFYLCIFDLGCAYY